MLKSALTLEDMAIHEIAKAHESGDLKAARSKLNAYAILFCNEVFEAIGDDIGEVAAGTPPSDVCH